MKRRRCNVFSNRCYMGPCRTQVEIDGLDIHEHGIASAYSGFAINDMTGMDMDVNENENTDFGEDDYSKASESQINAALQDVE